MKTYLISLLVILSSLAYSQESDIRTLLDEVKSKFTEVDDYVVDAEITVDVNFLNVPKSIAKIYFKQPDKVKLDSEGFAMLPKQGMNFSPAKLLNIDYTAIYVKNEIVDNYQTEVVKIIPNDSESDLILSTLWIDPDYKIIRKLSRLQKIQAPTIFICITMNTCLLDYRIKWNLNSVSETFSCLHQ
jgi:hypothetical protein